MGVFTSMGVGESMERLKRVTPAVFAALVCVFVAVLAYVMTTWSLDRPEPGPSRTTITVGPEPTRSPKATKTPTPKKPPTSDPSPSDRPTIQVDPKAKPSKAAQRRVLNLAASVCAEALDRGRCSDYLVRIGNTGSAEGIADIRSRFVASGGKVTSKVWVREVVLSPRLAGQAEDYIRFVAAHEFNHVEQVERARTVERYRQMQDRANDYFTPRAKVGVKVQGTTAGIELLTDCMTWFGDGVRPGPEVLYPVSGYTRLYLSSTTMTKACGTGWKGLLPG